MTADLSNEKRCGSFHYQYSSFIKAAQSENYSACNNEPPPYEDYDDYLWFIEQMRKELKNA
ncbi:MAG: hypothetical protein LBM69_02105 [Lachnospiraceae bacterium]|jgi:hypothetical protein|nr:hypothetical protein [Lachnospiraceae bacterium]